MYDQMHDGEKDFPKSHLNVNEQNLFFLPQWRRTRQKVLEIISLDVLEKDVVRILVSIFEFFNFC